jgi:hypothetical protein
MILTQEELMKLLERLKRLDPAFSVNLKDL